MDANQLELHAHLKSAYASGRVIYERVFPARRPSAVVRRLSGDPRSLDTLCRHVLSFPRLGKRLHQAQ